MLSIIIGAVVALIGVAIPLANPNSYSSDLEGYIKRKNPQNTYDVERFAREFEEKHSRPFI